jgi:hypothetical protein
VRELPAWLLIGFSWWGMYAVSLEISSWVGLVSRPWPLHLLNPVGSWPTGIIWMATFWVNLFFVRHVLEATEAGAKKEE